VNSREERTREKTTANFGHNARTKGNGPQTIVDYYADVSDI